MKSLHVLSSPESIPANNIYCIGRNYAAHALELGNAIEETPVVFLKPTSSLIFEGEKIRLPSFSRDVHHECELVLLIGKGGANISEAHALDHLLGYGIGLDLTARDVQSVAKKKGLPWTIAKGFDTSAAVSSFIDSTALSDPQKTRFTLRVNGGIRQQGDTSLMLYPVRYIISFLSTIFTLERGDIIFTGTPDGVAAIQSGDTLDLQLENLVHCQFHVG